MPVDRRIRDYYYNREKKPCIPLSATNICNAIDPQSSTLKPTSGPVAGIANRIHNRRVQIKQDAMIRKLHRLPSKLLHKYGIIFQISTPSAAMGKVDAHLGSINSQIQQPYHPAIKAAMKFARKQDQSRLFNDRHFCSVPNLQRSPVGSENTCGSQSGVSMSLLHKRWVAKRYNTSTQNLTAWCWIISAFQRVFSQGHHDFLSFTLNGPVICAQIT
ncbi:hypothetical protein BU17DRAFT_67708 [Hysterangium stoloniferum]|nr:hypothetical protein BU17DRAFT_67708 [Hysterangium stoloniferum]